MATGGGAGPQCVELYSPCKDLGFDFVGKGITTKGKEADG